MKYIDADKLIAEIESRMEDCKLPDGKFPTTTSIVRYEELSCLRNFISSLQQERPEVDLEKDIERIVKNEERFMNFQVKSQLIKYVARHFYELGLNAKKDD